MFPLRRQNKCGKTPDKTNFQIYQVGTGDLKKGHSKWTNNFQKANLTWCNRDHCSFPPVVKSSVTVNTSTNPTNKNPEPKVPTNLNILHQRQTFEDKTAYFTWCDGHCGSLSPVVKVVTVLGFTAPLYQNSTYWMELRSHLTICRYHFPLVSYATSTCLWSWLQFSKYWNITKTRINLQINCRKRLLTRSYCNCCSFPPVVKVPIVVAQWHVPFSFKYKKWKIENHLKH